MNNRKKILVYGANGYTAKLFIHHLLSNNIQPILAGRNKVIKKQAKKLNLEARIFEAKDSLDHLRDIAIVINLAGAFDITQVELLKACIQTGSHYLDIASDVNDVKEAYTYDQAAKEAKIIAIPGAGFGTTPTNIAALMALQELDDPKNLTILYSAQGKFSTGLKKYFLETVQKPGYIVKNGLLKPAKAGCKSKTFSVFGVNYQGFYNPWRGDLLSMSKNFDLETIETYSSFSPLAKSMIDGRRKWLRKLMLIKFSILGWQGPSKKELSKGRTYIKAIATNNYREKVTVEMLGPDSNIFTINCLCELTKLLCQEQTQFGVKAPSMFGSQLLDNIKGVKVFTKYKLEPIFEPEEYNMVMS